MTTKQNQTYARLKKKTCKTEAEQNFIRIYEIVYFVSTIAKYTVCVLPMLAVMYAMLVLAILIR